MNMLSYLKVNLKNIIMIIKEYIRDFEYRKCSKLDLKMIS